MRPTCTLLPAALAAVILALPVPARAADEVARATIKKAIDAHGGAVALNRFKAISEKSRGTVAINGKDADFTAETVVQLPNKLRNTLQLTVDGRQLAVQQVFDGTKGWLKINDEILPFDDATTAEAKETLYANRVQSLVDLLADDSFTLAAKPETKVRGRAANVVTVSSKGHEDVTLSFDKDSGLMSKLERKVAEKGRDYKQEEFYSDYRDVAGTKRAAKVEFVRDGLKFLSGTVVETEGIEKPSDDLFAKPGGAGK